MLKKKKTKEKKRIKNWAFNFIYEYHILLCCTVSICTKVDEFYILKKIIPYVSISGVNRDEEKVVV